MRHKKSSKTYHKAQAVVDDADIQGKTNKLVIFLKGELNFVLEDT